jgi:cysteinyl-tRNA synthetase
MHMAIRLYNTMSRNTDELRPVTSGLVRMYVCGVTVYDRAHIGQCHVGYCV